MKEKQSIKYLFVIWSFGIHVCSTQTTGANLTDLRKCKLSHSGVEYVGPVMTTESGRRCQYWDIRNPINKISVDVTDDKFPDGSRRLAKNSCRNPTHIKEGPWCYTLDPTVTDEVCDIPLCIIQGCRETGPGVEYAGKVKRSAFDNECRSWDKKHEKKKDEKGFKFSSKKFPGGSRGKAQNYCRNPGGNPAGPWCYVTRDWGEDEEEEVKELCDIPLCDDPDCLTFTSANSTGTHTHFMAINATSGNFTFALRLWNPETWPTATARLLLSSLATPATGKQFEKWQVGVEFFLSNRQTGVSAGGKEPDLRPSPHLFTGVKWTWFSLTWARGFLSLNPQGTIVPLITVGYETRGTGLGLPSGPFNFISIVGNGVMWDIPSCEEDCLVHTTSGSVHQRFWPLRKTATGHDVSTFLRARHSATLEFRGSPATAHPNVRIVLTGKKNVTIVTVSERLEKGTVVLKETKTPTLLDYWSWRDLTFSFFGNKFSVYWTRDVGTVTVLQVESELMRGMRWFSPASYGSVAHWTFFCRPTDEQQVPPAVLPECANTPSEFGYQGSQWTSRSGMPCLPWSDRANIPEAVATDQAFPDGSRVLARNFCRNLDKDPSGPFCYALNIENNTISKEYCVPRKCRTAECRMAGTGNDYMGKLNTTRSNRTCQHWSTNSPHEVDMKLLVDNLYPEQSYLSAENFCRNPSRNIAGSWCYTTDPNVTSDACNVRDCVMPEECTVLTRGVGTGRLVYILPQWRRVGLRFWLKEWNPDETDGIIFELRPKDGKKYYKLIVGADDNEKVKMFYSDEKGVEKLMKEKSLPHLIPIGKWGGFWLKSNLKSVELGYEGLETSLFDWTHDDETQGFRPMFMTYKSVVGNTIGVSFPCTDCHVENTTTPRITKILPLRMWAKEPEPPGRFHNFTFYARGRGIVLLPLMKLPGLGEYFVFTIGEKGGNSIYFARQIKGNNTVLVHRTLNYSIISETKWTRFSLRYNEHYMGIGRDGVLLLDWKQQEPMLMYWFSISVEDGYVIWSANCEPMDIDGIPIDGGWSEWGPWTCSVSCGGGVGVQKRTCTSPEPNIYGLDCEGSDTSEGKCNAFECGDLSPDTMELIVNRLQREHFNYEVLEGDPVTLEPDENMLQRVEAESPKGTHMWVKGGKEIIYDSRITLSQQSVLLINKAEPADNGVYVLTFHRVNKERMVLRVIALTVRPENYNVVTRETYDLSLRCNSLVLGYIYNDLSQKWLLNRTEWKDYGITTLEAVNTEEVKKLNRSHAGEWRCVVSQNDLQFSWVTNLIYVKIKSAPTFFTHLMEDKATAPFFSLFKTERNVKIVLVVILFLAIVLSVAGVLIYLKWCRLPQQKTSSKSKVLTANFSKYALLKEEDTDTQEAQNLDSDNQQNIRK